MASLYYIGKSRKGHRKIKVRTGYDKEYHGFMAQLVPVERLLAAAQTLGLYRGYTACFSG
jgi:hypothetical protein